ncbi:hypothetical protein AK830_g9173 [Neonectria ditissima]|uniref:Uncharacterized protein n=1 Tax=Neonectria ditissima TaxID=78410 RepID=A0A0N8H5X6_9HYPO|nr:hypothetical protein AK830_g9173 [Neonectria ditissima]
MPPISDHSQMNPDFRLPRDNLDRISVLADGTAPATTPPQQLSITTFSTRHPPSYRRSRRPLSSAKNLSNLSSPHDDRLPHRSLSVAPSPSFSAQHSARGDGARQVGDFQDRTASNSTERPAALTRSYRL